MNLWVHDAMHYYILIPKIQERSVSLACNSNKKETLAKVFSYKFCEISKNTFSYRTLPVAASERFLPVRLHFFMSNTFISNIRPKLGKNQAKAKHHPETEPFLSKN